MFQSWIRLKNEVNQIIPLGFKDSLMGTFGFVISSVMFDLQGVVKRGKRFTSCWSTGSLEHRRSDMILERQVLQGLRYLHRRKIVQKDIKPSNLLINKRQEVKITDFSMSKILSQTLDSREICGYLCIHEPQEANPRDVKFNTMVV